MISILAPAVLFLLASRYFGQVRHELALCILFALSISTPVDGGGYGLASSRYCASPAGEVKTTSVERPVERAGMHDGEAAWCRNFMRSIPYSGVSSESHRMVPAPVPRVRRWPRLNVMATCHETGPLAGLRLRGGDGDRLDPHDQFSGYGGKTENSGEGSMGDSDTEHLQVQVCGRFWMQADFCSQSSCACIRFMQTVLYIKLISGMIFGRREDAVEKRSIRTEAHRLVDCHIVIILVCLQKRVC